MLPPRQPVTLQIALTPGDYPCAVHVVPHQLRQLASQVSEVLLTVDTNRDNLRPQRRDEEAFVRLMRWIETLKADYPHLRGVEADYRPDTVRRLSKLYLTRGALPTRTYRGAFYAYFEGMSQAVSDHVLHLDSDIFIGGGSSTWVQEAISLLETHPDVLCCSPFPGPPDTDFRLRTQSGERLTEPRGAYRFQSFTTRAFFLDRRKITESPQKLILRRANLRHQVRAMVEGFSPLALPEDLMTDYMRSHGLGRVDFLGSKPGLWTLHPPFRNAEFFAQLPAIIKSVEAEEIPAGQRGDYDLNDSMVDWNSARAAIRHNRWWRRYLPKSLLP